MLITFHKLFRAWLQGLIGSYVDVERCNLDLLMSPDIGLNSYTGLIPFFDWGCSSIFNTYLLSLSFQNAVTTCTSTRQLCLRRNAGRLSNVSLLISSLKDTCTYVNYVSHEFHISLFTLISLDFFNKIPVHQKNAEIASFHMMPVSMPYKVLIKFDQLLGGPFLWTTHFGV